MSNEKGTPPHPPRWARHIFRNIAAPHLVEELEGDLLELFYKRLKTNSAHKAKILFVLDLIKLIHPRLWRHKKTSKHVINPMAMLRHSFIINYRNIIHRSKLLFVINYLGLTLGITASVIIYFYISYESSYDTFLGENLYRITAGKYEGNKLNYESAKSQTGLIHLLEELPAVKNSTRLLYEECLFRLGEKKVSNQKVFWADSTFVELFNLNIVKGGDKNLLVAPHEMLISTSAAVALFGNDWQTKKDLLHATVLLNEGLPFKISGVFSDFPQNSHMKFDYVLSFSTLISVIGKGFGETLPPGPSFIYLYTKLNDKSDSKIASNQINELIKQKVQNDKDISFKFNLQPVSSIHLNSHLADELTPNSNANIINILKVVALLIVVIATVNYINLSISSTIKRIHEIGVKKVLGASRSQMAIQFLTDSIIAFTTILAISSVLFLTFINLVNSYLDIQIPNQFYFDPKVWLVVLSIIAVITLLPSLYMGFVLKSIVPTSSGIKQPLAFGKAGYFRKGLIILQFVASTFLISSTILISRQVNLMQNFDHGYNKENVIVINTPRTLIDKPERENLFSVFKNKLGLLPEVASVGSGSEVPGKEFLMQSGNVKLVANRSLEGLNFSVGFADQNFFKTLGINLIAGKPFNEKDVAPEVIINNQALHSLGFKYPEDAIGQEIEIFGNGDKQKIVGVIEDYHHVSIHKKPTETIFIHAPYYQFGYYPVRVQGQHVQSTIQGIQKIWVSLYPEDPFDFFFMDSLFENQYKREKLFERIFVSFSILAILISCLGLFGLSLYNLQLRQREVCIRSVLGATSSNNIYLLSKEYIRIVILGIIISLPIIIYFGNVFLDSFPYRVNNDPTYFILVALGVLIISFLTILANVIKILKQNPAEVLKTNN